MNLLSGNILVTLTKLSIPMIWGMFSIVIFNLADTYFIGQLGAKELAAVSFTFPVIMFFGSISIGMTTGATAVISNYFGKKDLTKVRRLGTDSIILALIIVAVFSVLGFFTIDETFNLMGANDEMMPFIKEYMNVWYLGMVFIVPPMLSNGAIRASGNTFIPAMIMTVAAITNIILDPIFIFGAFGIPAMGVKGAAIATVISRAITLVASLYFSFFKLKILCLEIPTRKDFTNSCKAILKIGLPSAGINIVTPISFAIITAILAQFGNDIVAAFGVATRLESLAMLVIIGFSVAVAPFTGQNFGAGNIERIKKAFHLSVYFCLIWGALIGSIFFIFGKELATYFNSKEIIVANAALYLSIVPISYGLEGVRLVSANIYNSLGRPIPPSAMAILRMFVIVVPVAYFGAKFYGIPGAFSAQLAGNIIVGIIAIIYLKKDLLSLVKNEK